MDSADMPDAAAASPGESGGEDAAVKAAAEAAAEAVAKAAAEEAERVRVEAEAARIARGTGMVRKIRKTAGYVRRAVVGFMQLGSRHMWWTYVWHVSAMVVASIGTIYAVPIYLWQSADIHIDSRTFVDMDICD